MKKYKKWIALFDWRRGRGARAGAAIVVVLIATGAVALFSWRRDVKAPTQLSDVSSQSKNAGAFYPTTGQWQSLTIKTVDSYPFRLELNADGKIAIDEDHSTPIFSPYAGRVMKLLAKPGDVVERGQPLFTVEASDMVQAQNDFIAASTALNKSHSQLNLAQIVDKRQRDLYEGKAVPLKEVQNARAALDGAENDVRSGEVALEAARNRLRILGKTDNEISDFQEKGSIDPSTPIHSPITGTIVQRKVGPGQYIGAGASDPIFVVGDLSTVWLVANVKESEGSHVKLGQPLEFRVSALPERLFAGKVSYVAEDFDPNTRRLTVRAIVENPNKLLKPNMFASVTVYASDGQPSPAVPREAIVYEGNETRVWVAAENKSLSFRKITVGLINGNLVQVSTGLQPGDRIVTQGALFIDRAAHGSES
jgi:cobalt-zinc-cadmium efflux system membrane fusion protein